ncbi:putative coat protein [Erysiphe necator associated levi-like virus 1]|nr:putative coat protein [Erysiphe necator associated levi-like virus 1]
MALFGVITIHDGKATPEAHTFAPAYRRDNELGWADRSAGVLAGYRQISLQVRPATNANAGTRVNIKVKDPRLAVLGVNDQGIVPTPVKAYETLAEVSFMLPSGSDRQARLDILAYMANLLARDQIKDSIVDLAQPV